MGYSKEQIEQMFNTKMGSVMTRIDRARQEEETAAYNEYVLRQEKMAQASLALSALKTVSTISDSWIDRRLKQTYDEDITKDGILQKKKYEMREGWHPFKPTQKTRGYKEFLAGEERLKAEKQQKQQLIEDKRSAFRPDVPDVPVAVEDEFFDEEVTVDEMPDDLLAPMPIPEEDLQKMDESAKKALYDQYYQGQAEGLHPERMEEIPDYQTWQKMVKEGEVSGKYTEKIPAPPERPDVPAAFEDDFLIPDEDIIETPDDLTLPPTRPTDISTEDLQRIQDEAEATKGWAETDPYAVPGSREMSLRDRRAAQARLQEARPGTIQRGYSQQPISEEDVLSEAMPEEDYLLRQGIEAGEYTQKPISKEDVLSEAMPEKDYLLRQKIKAGEYTQQPIPEEDIVGEFGAEGGFEGGTEGYEQQQKLKALRELETKPGVVPEVSSDSELEKALAEMEAGVKKPSFLKKSLQTIIPGGEKGWGWPQKGREVGDMTASAGTSDVFTPTGEKLGDVGVEIPDAKPDLLKTGGKVVSGVQDVAGAVGQIKTLTGEGTDEEKIIAGTKLTSTGLKAGGKLVEKAGGKVVEKVGEEVGEKVGEKTLGKTLGTAGKALGATVGVYTGLKTAFSEEASDVERFGGGLQAIGSGMIGTGFGAPIGAILAAGGTLLSMFGGKKKRRPAPRRPRMDLGRFYQPARRY